MKTIELTPINRKSFYGKAKVFREGSHLTLFSYETKVATFRTDLDGSLWIIKHKPFLTRTTLRHINSFLIYCGFETMTKKQILDL